MLETLLKKSLDKVADVQGLAKHLENLLNSGCYVWTESNGERLLLQGRALVERINGLKIYIYSNEHSPPHFHVISADVNAEFSISDCTLLRGRIDRKTRALIVYWYDVARPKLIEFWNNSRPTNCPVGPIRDVHLDRVSRGTTS